MNQGDHRDAGRAVEPTRIALLRYLDEATRPVGVQELANRFELHHTSVRAHLQRLVDDGLVVPQRDEQTRLGRPRILYRATPRAARELGTAIAPYEQLASMLAAIVHTGASACEVGRADGRHAVIEHGIGNADDSVGRLVDEMDRRGFEAAARNAEPCTEIVLGACPYEHVARLHPRTVCDLHLGYAEGYADALGDLRVIGLERHDPSQAQCVLSVALVPNDG